MTETSDVPQPPDGRHRSGFDLLAIALGTGLGVGFAPFAPGTFGSLWGPLLIWAMIRTGLPPAALLVLGAVFIGLGIPICSGAARALGKKDPGSVVYDEIAAFWLVLLPQVLGMRPLTWTNAVLGFALFRLFDITKPWPVRRLEKLPDGTGIMADDLAAGVYAGALLILIETAIAYLS